MTVYFGAINLNRLVEAFSLKGKSVEVSYAT